jgi:hypothetical protein
LSSSEHQTANSATSIWVAKPPCDKAETHCVQCSSSIADKQAKSVVKEVILWDNIDAMKTSLSNSDSSTVLLAAGGATAPGVLGLMAPAAFFLMTATDETKLMQ